MRDRRAGALHSPDALVDMGVTWQASHLLRRQLEETNVSLLDRDLRANHVDLLLRQNCLGFDLLHQLSCDMVSPWI
jgi:hypothetical protein